MKKDLESYIESLKEKFEQEKRLALRFLEAKDFGNHIHHTCLANTYHRVAYNLGLIIKGQET
jgi:hypothetical protein